MGARILDPRLKELYDAGAKIYSISKINTIDECLYEAYNAYILHNKGQNGVYGILGGKIHDCLEAITNGEATTDVLLPALEEELSDLEMLDLSFPKDFRGGDSIRDNWVADMKHFCQNFMPLEGEFDTEELFIYKLNDNRYVQGYIDLIRHNDDGTISIMDWKTSSEFTKEDLVHHGRQLVLYAIAKEEQGFEVRDVAWIMLKYCKVTFMGKKRSNAKTLSPITKVVNRGKLVKELKPHIEYDLTAAGYDEIDIECILAEALEKNSLECLPEQIRDNYKVELYVREYEITDELKQECLDYINSRADMFEGLDADNAANFPPREFVKIGKNGKEKDESFFCNVLCNYRNTCKHIKEFNEKRALAKEDDKWEEELF